MTNPDSIEIYVQVTDRPDTRRYLTTEGLTAKKLNAMSDKIGYEGLELNGTHYNGPVYARFVFPEGPPFYLIEIEENEATNV